MLPMAVLGTSTVISNERAKAESLGYQAKGGLMERAERIIALAAGLAIPALLVPVLWLMLVLTSFTAVQRFVKVWKQASADRPAPKPIDQRPGFTSPVAERFRAWKTSQLGERAGARWRVVREQRRTRARRVSGSRRP